jgi:hypothetical protein
VLEIDASQYKFKVMHNERSDQVLKIHFAERGPSFINLTKLKNEPSAHMSVHSDSLVGGGNEDFNTTRINIRDFLTANPIGKHLKSFKMKNASSV